MSRRAVVTHSVEETWQVAGEVQALCAGQGVIALHGELGAGKTCFVQGLGRALGVARPVTSPTFTIVNEYRGRVPLYHIDLYRLSGPDEVLALGFDDYLEAGGITAVEWPDRAEGLLPTDTLHVWLSLGDHPRERLIRIERAA